MTRFQPTWRTTGTSTHEGLRWASSAKTVRLLHTSPRPSMPLICKLMLVVCVAVCAGHEVCSHSVSELRQELVVYSM